MIYVTNVDRTYLKGLNFHGLKFSRIRGCQIFDHLAGLNFHEFLKWHLYLADLNFSNSRKDEHSSCLGVISLHGVKFRGKPFAWHFAALKIRRFSRI